MLQRRGRITKPLLVMFVEILTGKIIKNNRIIGDNPIFAAEILTIREVVKHATQQINLGVIIGSDSLIVIEAINRKNIPPFVIGNLVDDIKNLALQIDNITFQFCRRSANTIAGRIGKQVPYDYTSQSCD